MTLRRQERIREFVHGAMGLEPSARSAYLDLHCSSDPSLREEIAALLAANPGVRNRVLESTDFAQVPPGQEIRRPMALTPGTKLGPYEITAFLGAGGMGEVYRARDTRLDRTVAIKVLPAHLWSDPSRRQRFRREARAVSALQHSNICTLYDIGQQDSTDYLVMEYVDGQALSARLSQGPLQVAQILRYGIELADALDTAHLAGILHRDLKPANLLLTSRGQVKIVDFGLAKLAQPPSEVSNDTDLSEPKIAMGTPPYMAPEQVRGGTTDVRTDIWGVGTVLYEMCTGQRPFPESQSPLLVDAILNKSPQLPHKVNSQVPGGLECVVVKALEKDPDRRYQTARDLGEALERVQAGVATRSDHFPSWWVTVGLILLAVVGASWFVTRHRGPTSVLIQVRPSVAILGFKDLGGRSETAWLSPALSEMLTTELEAGDKMRIIPGESVVRTKSDLRLVDSDSLAQDTLTRIRSQLGSDLIVLGSYLDMGKESGGQIRLDLRIQDARSGDTIGSLTENGTEAGLLGLVSRSGSDLREKLGAGKTSESESARLKASQPATFEAVHLYTEALGALRVFDALRAHDLLQRAIAADPNNPNIHAAEAQAWSALGYEGQARAEAKRAFELSDNLPPTEKLLIEARYRQAAAQWDHAIEIYRKLYSEAPDNIEYGLYLASAQVQGSRGQDALRTVSTLRKLPFPEGDDPRIDLAEAEATNYISDFKRELVSAETAARKANARGAHLLVAQARIAEGRAFRNLGQPEKSNTASEAARALFAEVGDRLGEARALHTIGAVAYDRGDLAGALRAFEESLAIRQQIGNRKGAGSELNAVAVVLTHQKNIAGAMKAYEESLNISRELGDLIQVGVTLNNVGTLQKDTDNFAAAHKSFEEALAIDRKIGNQLEVANALQNLGLMLTTEGDLAGARSDYEQALQVSRDSSNKFGIGASLINLAELQIALGDLATAEKLDAESYKIFQSSEQRVFASWPLYGLAEIQLKRDDLAGARQKHEEALALRRQAGEKREIGESLMALSEVYREQGQLTGAETAAHEALLAFQDAGDFEGQSRTQVSVAINFLAQSRLADAEHAIAQARILGRRSASVALKIEVDLADARVLTARAKGHEAEPLIQRSLTRSRQLRLLGLEYQARLAAGELELKSGKTSVGNTMLQTLQKDALSRDFRLIARKAATMARVN